MISVKLQPPSPCLPNFTIFSDTDVTIKPIQPQVIVVGNKYFLTTTDNKTVLKGHQAWFDSNLVFDYGVTYEEHLAQEATIYEYLGKHPRILTCFGLES